MFFGYFSLKFSNAKIPKQSIENKIGVSQSSGRDEDACHFRLNSFNNCAKSVLWMTCRLKDCGYVKTGCGFMTELRSAN